MLAQLREAYGIRVVPLHVPVGEHQGISATIDLLHGQVLKGPKEPIAEIDKEQAESVGQFRQQLVEAIVETNEDLLTRYLDGKEMSYDELRDALHSAVREGKVIPVVATSSSKNVGYAALLNTIREMLPSPAEDTAIIGKSPAGEETARKTVPTEKFSAFVFKTLADPFVGKLSYVRVYSGTLHHNSQVYDATKGETERVGQIFFLRGKEQEIAAEVGAGDICAIPKLTATSTNATLTRQGRTDPLRPHRLPAAVLLRGDRSREQGRPRQDVDRAAQAHRRGPVTPCAPRRRDPRDDPVRGRRVGHRRRRAPAQGEVRRPGRDAHAARAVPRIDPHESIGAGTVQAPDRRPRAVRGRVARGRAAAAGSGVVFDTRIVGGSVPRNFWPAVEKGIREQALKGVIAGYPLSDFKATLFDGSFHQVDSSEMSFKIAGSLALQACVKDAQPYLLEPIMDVEVVVPEEQMGDVLADLNSRRGRVLGMDGAGAGHQSIKAHVPAAEIFRYSTDLRSMTGGRGTFTATLLGYEQCPSHIAREGHRGARGEGRGGRRRPLGEGHPDLT